MPKSGLFSFLFFFWMALLSLLSLMPMDDLDLGGPQIPYMDKWVHMGFYFVAMLLGWPLPLVPIQLLVLNLITDGAPALALGVAKGDPDIMDRKPRPVREPIINRDMVTGIVVQTVAISLAVLIAFQVGMQQGPTVARSMAFATLSISELLRAYTSRSERYSIWAIGIFTNKWMQWAVLVSLAILLAIIYVPFLQPIFDTTSLAASDWLVMLPLILVPSVAAEINKWVLRKMSQRELLARVA